MTRHIGLLHTGTEEIFADLVDMVRKELPKDVELHTFYADDKSGKLEDDARTLVDADEIEVIVAAGGPPSAIAAKYATLNADKPERKKTPVVFTSVTDPVDLKLVKTLDKPGTNLTGVAGQTSETDPERLELLYKFVEDPPTKKIGVLIHSRRPKKEEQFKVLLDAAKTFDKEIKLIPKHVESVEEIEEAFGIFDKKGFLGVVVTADLFFNNNRSAVIAAANEAGVPTIYQWRVFVEEGGLISYGPKISEAYKKAGEYVKTILEKKNVPAKMACWVPPRNSFELVVNTETADDLGLKLPDKIGNRKVQKLPPP